MTVDDRSFIEDNFTSSHHYNVTKEYMFDALDLRVADRLGSGSKLTSWRTELFKKRLEEVQHEPFSVKDLKIDGHDVMKELNLKPSPKIGEILEKLFAEVEAGKLKNDRDELLTNLTSHH
jgi:tRNA nucleotidyltransferase/poly(A) polymerase